MSFSSASEVCDALRKRPVRHLIDGKLVDSEERIEVFDPASASPVATAPRASTAQLEQAVIAASAAQLDWKERSVDERRMGLLDLARVLRDNRDELGALITLEQGRPLMKARDEVTRAAHLLEALVSIDIGDDLLRADTNGRVVMHHAPLGVVGAIAPWNVPIGLAVPKISHALYTGNTLVLKPSPYTPLATLRLGELAADLFPAGVLNVLAGDDELGAALCRHPMVAKITLTGSVRTGRLAMQAASGDLKRLTLELGGNDAAIVCKDADVAQVAPALFAAAFVNSGQVCMAIKRLFVHEDIHDELCAAMSSVARSIAVGSGFDPTVELGPVQNARQFASVQRVLEDCAKRPEARMLSGGQQLPATGYFVSPTIVSGLREGTLLVDEETFGPVLPILSYRDEEEAIARSNATPFGLGASVWTRDIDSAHNMARRLRAGTVWINRHVGADPGIPFGGLKSSGIGCQFGRQGLMDFMESSAIYIPGA